MFPSLCSYLQSDFLLLGGFVPVSVLRFRLPLIKVILLWVTGVWGLRTQGVTCRLSIVSSCIHCHSLFVIQILLDRSPSWGCCHGAMRPPSVLSLKNIQFFTRIVIYYVNMISTYILKSFIHNGFHWFSPDASW